MTIVDYQGRTIQACHSCCPAVTGQPSGTVKICPMVEWERHRADESIQCCANFQCCLDIWEASGLMDTMHMLVAGIPLVEVTRPEQ